MIKRAVDTSIEAEKIQIRLLQQSNPAHRVLLACSLSKSIVQLSRRGLARRHRDLSSRDLDLLSLGHYYGSDLAERVKRYLEEKHSE